MVSESYIYKNELLKFAADLQKRQNQKRWTDRTSLFIEKELFFGFFMIRKLCETITISDSLKVKCFPVSVLSINAPFDINFTTEHKVLDYIDWKNQTSELMQITKICNQFIHSFLISVLVNENGGFEGVLISSDWFKSKKCFWIEAGMIIQIFEEFGNNYPSELHWRREPGTCKLIEYIVK